MGIFGTYNDDVFQVFLHYLQAGRRTVAFFIHGRELVQGTGTVRNVPENPSSPRHYFMKVATVHQGNQRLVLIFNQLKQKSELMRAITWEHSRSILE